MGITQDAIDDAAEFTANTDDFAVQIKLRAPDNETATIYGYSRKHHKKLDQITGMVVNSKNASVTVHEKNILSANPKYGLRIAEADNDHYGEVDMLNHLVSVKDSSGVEKDYAVIENFADETLGTIVLILQDYRE